MATTSKSGQTRLNSLEVSAFCESLAMMLSAGIPVEEAVGLLGEDAAENDFKDAAGALHDALLDCGVMSQAVSQCGILPEYAASMIAAGESAGRTEGVLRSLAHHYGAQARLEQKLKSALVYPLGLLGLMAVILAVLVATVLPVFGRVYQSLAGDLATSSYGYLRFGQAVGWVGLGLTLAAAACLLVCLVQSRTPAGRRRLETLSERLPLTRKASASLAVARFTGALSVFLASGVNVDSAMEAACNMVTHRDTARKLEAARARMEAGDGLCTAIYEEKLFEPLYGRMLLSSARAGSAEATLEQLAQIFSEDSNRQMDRLIDSIEPLLAGFLTVAVGLTLLSAMLPLIGILGSIG